MLCCLAPSNVLRMNDWFEHTRTRRVEARRELPVGSAGRWMDGRACAPGRGPRARAACPAASARRQRRCAPLLRGARGRPRQSEAGRPSFDRARGGRPLQGPCHHVGAGNGAIASSQQRALDGPVALAARSTREGSGAAGDAGGKPFNRPHRRVPHLAHSITNIQRQHAPPFRGDAAGVLARTDGSVGPVAARSYERGGLQRRLLRGAGAADSGAMGLAARPHRPGGSPLRSSGDLRSRSTLPGARGASAARQSLAPASHGTAMAEWPLSRGLGCGASPTDPEPRAARPAPRPRSTSGARHTPRAAAATFGGGTRPSS
jgi:hypothetical protein